MSQLFAALGNRWPSASETIVLREMIEKDRARLASLVTEIGIIKAASEEAADIWAKADQQLLAQQACRTMAKRLLDHSQQITSSTETFYSTIASS
jgi:hypothetical protein